MKVYLVWYGLYEPSLEGIYSNRKAAEQHKAAISAEDHYTHVAIQTRIIAETFVPQEKI